MIQFTKLRLQGFKSFVDKTELEIGLGLTGVVGPNGCGKSNLVEALRWNMGESSTKRMRGGSRSMDDVIFNGTERRPSRNVAETSIVLDNSAHTAPAPYTTVNELEVVRKIERDHGSTYRINGKVVRARDVQLLYADIVSGANSPFLVSQGKITNIIQAKPIDRRLILEEAAGITGLHARRHEAELRLRATDNNLKRLEDLLGTMEGRYQALKRQARQANRYRNLSAEIRDLSTKIICLEYIDAHNSLQDIQNVYDNAESKVAERLVVVTQLTKTQNVQSKDLPDLRQEQAQSLASLQTQKIALQRLEDEKERLSTHLQEIEQQLTQLAQDREDVGIRLKDDSVALDKMNSEEKHILDVQTKEQKDLSQKEESKDNLKIQVTEAEEEYNALVESYVSKKAHKQSLENRIESETERLSTLKSRINSLSETLDDKKGTLADEMNVDDLKQQLIQLDEQHTKLKADIENTESDITDKRNDLKSEQDKRQETLNKKLEISSEIKTLESIVNLYSDDDFKPVLEDITAASGFENALSRALGDSLLGSRDDNAPVFWNGYRSDLEFPLLPSGIDALSSHVDAPEELHAALSQIGIVGTEDEGHQKSADLKVGQSLVSKTGMYWRWDGLVIKQDAADRHSEQLKQKNKLLELGKEIPKLDNVLSGHDKKIDKIQSELTQREEKLQSLKTSSEETRKQIQKTRTTLDQTVESQSQARMELAKLEEALDLANEDVKTLETSIKTHSSELSEFSATEYEDDEQKREEKRSALNALREKYQIAMKDYDVALQEQSRRKARIQAIGDERVNLHNRVIRGKERLKELDVREAELKTKQAHLQKRPKEIEVESEKLLSVITTKEQANNALSDKLEKIETDLAETTKALKEAEQLLAEAKETRAHSQATIEERQKQIEALSARVREQFDKKPKDLLVEANLDQENLPDLNVLREQRDHATKSRDSIGPVNLRAEQEAMELEKELGSILSEKSDLAEAIEELRAAIQKLNNEARERLNAAFEHVNGHFREIFGRLFNGGKAHLSLIENEDPMESGLEIFAQPPGKTLQSLSLLSGGEQTLTAIALIFAMFLTNPAPICVLDEVDAPLDDANVDRFCDLLEEFAERGETRFLVITHHRLTMARMDRLYGVTMTEKGVSKLVSVDLNQQLDFLDAAE